MDISYRIFYQTKNSKLFFLTALQEERERLKISSELFKRQIHELEAEINKKVSLDAF